MQAPRVDLVLAWGALIVSVQWSLFATLTFPECPGEEYARRKFNRWRRYVRLELVRRYSTPLSCLVPARGARMPRPPRCERRFALWSVNATEWQHRGAIHFHSLIGAPPNLRPFLIQLSRVDAANEWRRLTDGHADVQPVRSPALVAAYLAKYVAKAALLDVLVPVDALRRECRIVGSVNECNRTRKPLADK
jgi:hypothetical protein